MSKAEPEDFSNMVVEPGCLRAALTLAHKRHSPGSQVPSPERSWLRTARPRPRIDSGLVPLHAGDDEEGDNPDDNDHDDHAVLVAEEFAPPALEAGPVGAATGGESLCRSKEQAAGGHESRRPPAVTMGLLGHGVRHVGSTSGHAAYGRVLLDDGGGGATGAAGGGPTKVAPLPEIRDFGSGTTTRGAAPSMPGYAG